MADSDNSPKSERRTVSLRSLLGASLEGLQGIKRQLEDEIRVLEPEIEGDTKRQLEDELRRVEQWIQETKDLTAGQQTKPEIQREDFLAQGIHLLQEGLRFLKEQRSTLTDEQIQSRITQLEELATDLSRIRAEEKKAHG